ncbi:MAG: YdcF family protein [Desulfobacterales bacterium]|nr:YdcF family protein [Desulfobacterales bacterium]
MSSEAYEIGFPGIATLIRLKKGIELYKQGYAKKIVCAGGIYFERINKSIAEIMKNTLVLFGIPSEDILIQDDTINTYNDITGVIKKFEKTYNFNQSLFVTSSFHTYRVKAILKKKGIDAKVISADPYELTPKIWSERLELFQIIIREYLAICYFKLKGYA